MAGHQTIGGNPGVPHIHNILEKISKGKKILFLFEDGLTPSAAVHNMVPCVGVLNSQRSGHVFSYHIQKVELRADPIFDT
jgi:hypothetical protein